MLGEDLIERALSNPQGCYVGVEYSRKKLDKVLSKAAQSGVENFRVLHADAARILHPLFPASSLIRVFILFPDPWPKKRHHKKRLIQSNFVRQLAEKMIAGADLELRTDDHHYFGQMMEVLEAEPVLRNRVGAGAYLVDPLEPNDYIPTIFESKFREMGKTIYYLYYQKSG